jgi:hypothetical protein
MLKRFRADLHIHTCLSPCGDLSMVPGVIVEEARKKGLQAIGICDHNASENVLAVREVAERNGIAVLGGMEITSREEVHVLALFDDDEKLLELQKEVYDNLPGVNDAGAFGEQVVVNGKDEVVDVNERLLIGATELGLSRIVEATHSLSGLAIASHVDRESFGIFGQLGFIPEGLALDALELWGSVSPWKAKEALPRGAGGFPLVTFSDAHYPHDIGTRCTTFLVETPALHEIRKALRGEGGRSAFPEE